MSTPWILVLQTLLGAALALALLSWVKTRRPALAGLVLLLLVGVATPIATWEPVVPGAGPRIRIISVLDQATTQALVTSFTAETGIECDVDPFAGGTQSTVDLIRQGRVQPDVLLGGTVEIHQSLAQDDKLAALELPHDPQRVDDFDDPERRWTPLYLGYLALVYRPLPSLQSHPPEWVTLIQSPWNGRVSIPSPASSGGGLVFLATQIMRQNDPETGWRYMQALGEAGAWFEDRSDVPISRVASGTMDLGVAWAHDILRRRETERLPVEVRIPEQTGYEVGGVSVLSWARDLAAATEFVRFLTGPVAAEIQAREGRRVPLRTDVDPPAYVDGGRLDASAVAFYDRSAVLNHRADWIQRWSGLEAGSP